MRSVGALKDHTPIDFVDMGQLVPPSQGDKLVITRPYLKGEVMTEQFSILAMGFGYQILTRWVKVEATNEQRESIPWRSIADCSDHNDAINILHALQIRRNQRLAYGERLTK